MFNKLLKLDWILIITSLLLLGIGLLALYSISTVQEEGKTNVFLKQTFFAALAIGAMLFFAFSNYHYLKSYSTPIYFFTLFLLGMVLFFGSDIRGTSGWLGLGPFHIQPIEIAKLSLIIFLASFISQKKSELGGTGRLIVSFILTSFMIFLVGKQPDFGGALILAGIWLGMMLLSGVNKKHFVLMVLAGAVISVLVWLILAPYQKERIFNVIRPVDPKGSGYNVAQSTVAIGSGGIIGKGIGHGSQSQLNFIPEKHTDFIFAVLAEEMGLVGSLFVLVLYFVLFYRIKKIAQWSADNFGYLLASGVLVMLFLQVMVNIGMAIGIMPVTGIPLPLLSYGGSSLVTVFAALGILLNTYIERSKISKSHLFRADE